MRVSAKRKICPALPTCIASRNRAGNNSIDFEIAGDAWYAGRRNSQRPGSAKETTSGGQLTKQGKVERITTSSHLIHQSLQPNSPSRNASLKSQPRYKAPPISRILLQTQGLRGEQGPKCTCSSIILGFGSTTGIGTTLLELGHGVGLLKETFTSTWCSVTGILAIGVS